MGSSTLLNAAPSQPVLEAVPSIASAQAALSPPAPSPALFGTAARGWRLSGEDPLFGRTLEWGYHVGSLLARSATSRIYRGRHMVTGVPCVLKLARNPEDARARVRLRREAYLTQQISHPHVVRLLYQGELAGFSPYLALEDLGGTNLAMLIAQGPLPVTSAVYIAAQLASALYAVHQLGIEHRDVSPANVMLSGGEGCLPEVKLIDFGVAGYAFDGATDAVIPLVGTPQYVAPERIKGERTGPLSDQYSLGCVLYEMLTGQAPHRGESVIAILEGHLRGRPLPPRQLCPEQEIPVALEYAVMRALALDPTARFESMAVFCTALVACLGSSSLSRYLTLRSI